LRATAPCVSAFDVLTTLATSAWSAGRAALDLLLPPTCLTCDAPVDAPGRFCPECFAFTGFVTEPCCRRCGVPFAHASQGGAEKLCPSCRDRPPPWGRARAALRYDTQARRIVLPLKYGDRTEYAGALAPLMVRAGAALLRDAELLVPVPLHRRRLIQRRYNQAALLAHAVARLAGKPVLPDALKRTRVTVSLGDLSAAERARVVDGAFAVRTGRAGSVAGRKVLLVDDVLTSGATCAACTRALFAAGASAVDVLVAARVPDPRLR
jgi:ComF family protein